RPRSPRTGDPCRSRSRRPSRGRRPSSGAVRTARVALAAVRCHNLHTELYPQPSRAMNPEDLARFLNQSLADHKLSGSEKSALADWLAKNVQTDQPRDLARDVAFEVAKRALADP